MLQAYVDESITRTEDGSTFVMAGYIATEETWAAFSAEWRDLLSMKSPHYAQLDEYHSNEMPQRNERRMEQSKFFYRVIEKHLHTYAACSVRIEDIKDVHAEINWPTWLDNVDVLADEYYTAFDQFVRGLTANQHRLGIHEPVNVILDEGHDQEKCLRGWGIAKKWGHPAVRSLLGETPEFRDSKANPPLQAADMLAYWLRESQLRTPLQAPDFNLRFPWSVQSKDMTGFVLFFTRDMIRRNFYDIKLACSMLKAGARSQDVQYVMSLRKRDPNAW